MAFIYNNVYYRFMTECSLHDFVLSILEVHITKINSSLKAISDTEDKLCCLDYVMKKTGLRYGSDHLRPFPFFPQSCEHHSVASFC